MVRRVRRAIRRRGAPPVPEAAETADTVLRLAVLLRAGVAPGRAWRFLADGGEPVADRVCAVIAEGGDVARALAAEGGAWR